ncbi:hypothetical protein PoB_000643100 [Plakobranchus ocellatus]|uniref:Uncharacterized protein n=1 Tax=Plakobranchus ocellatus TaxID=259542 RepID=A0AAV3XYA1_9GAST|nr:hypothetical protein PoB_000643100 [Plakobranchus ocellatus]
MIKKKKKDPDSHPRLTTSLQLYRRNSDLLHKTLDILAFVRSVARLLSRSNKAAKRRTPGRLPLKKRATDVRLGCETQRIAPTLRQIADLVCARTKEREYLKTCTVGHVNCCSSVGLRLISRDISTSQALPKDLHPVWKKRQ